MKSLLAAFAALMLLSLPSVCLADLSVTSSSLQGTSTPTFTPTDNSDNGKHDSTVTTYFAPTPGLGSFSGLGDLPSDGDTKPKGRSITFDGGWSLLIAVPDSGSYNFKPNTLSGPLDLLSGTGDAPLAPTPEPSTLMLMLLGTASLGASGLIRRKLAV
jgi:hypothetical protein